MKKSLFRIVDLLVLIILLVPAIAYADLKGVIQNPSAVLSSGNFTSGHCVKFSNTGNSGALISDTGSACGSGSGGVTSVTNSDGSVIFSPTTGNVIGSLNTAHNNMWTGTQLFGEMALSPSHIVDPSNGNAGLYFDGGLTTLVGSNGSTVLDFSSGNLNDSNGASSVDASGRAFYDELGNMVASYHSQTPSSTAIEAFFVNNALMVGPSAAENSDLYGGGSFFEGQFSVGSLSSGNITLYSVATQDSVSTTGLNPAGVALKIDGDSSFNPIFTISSTQFGVSLLPIWLGESGAPVLIGLPGSGNPDFDGVSTLQTYGINTFNNTSFFNDTASFKNGTTIGAGPLGNDGWINLPTGGASGIGTGGVGINPFLAYVFSNDNYFHGTVNGDMIIRNATAHRMWLGIDNGSGTNTPIIQMAYSSGNQLGFFNAATVAQQSGNISTALSNYGLVTSGTLPFTALTGTAAAAQLPLATSAAVGGIKGDGSTITITSGTASCTTATSAQIGCAKFGSGLSVSAGNVTTTNNGTVTNVATGVGLSGGPISGSGTIVSNAVYQIAFQPGLLTSVTNTKSVFGVVSKASTVDNITASALLFTCVSNPTITFYECGTSSSCATPTSIGSATVTASGQAFTGTISSASVTAGDFVAWAISAGTCTSLDISATAQIHSN